MAKSKNHTNHNQSFKEHRNGIKKPSRVYKHSLRGVYLPLKKNTHFSVKHNKGSESQRKLRAAAKKN